jgi:hypothetical protein
VHDDVEVVCANVDAVLNEGVDEGFAILGLAGATKAKVRIPATWDHMMEPGFGSGCSIFRNAVRDKNGQQVQNPSQPYPTPFGPLGEVVFLDGLLIAVALDQAKGVRWQFDEDYDFQHYDVASCIRARDAGLRIRTVFIPVVHWSLGLVSFDDRFLASQTKFVRSFAGRRFSV